MQDSWSKKQADGRTVTYTSHGEAGAGFVHTVAVEGRSVTETTSSLGPLTREQVEALFADFVGKN